jgi:hypothetical protein
MSNVQESYPTATVGTSVASVLALSGTGITNASPQTQPGGAIAGGGLTTYTVTLSLSSAGGKSNTVSVTGQINDSAGTNQTASTGTFQANSFNAYPTANGPHDVQESYPVPVTTVGQIATVGAVTNNNNGTCSFTVTSVAKGQAVVELEYPAFTNKAGTISSGNVSSATTFTWPLNMIYAQLLVNVIA